MPAKLSDDQVWERLLAEMPGDVRQLLLWGPAQADELLEDPDDRPYTWDLPDGA